MIPTNGERVDATKFAAVLREVFIGESWSDIEDCAADAWKQLATDEPWDDAKGRIKRAWQQLQQSR
ncbi:hypothetical protein [Lysobacter terrae]